MTLISENSTGHAAGGDAIRAAHKEKNQEEKTQPSGPMQCFPLSDSFCPFRSPFTMIGVPIAACANCGKDSRDAVELKTCAACLLVKYCNVDCQRDHRKHHKVACKKGAAELKDERLYTQGRERSEDDFCPICTLPIPLQMNDHSGFRICCMKRVCHGCEWDAQIRGMIDCPFCRTPRHEDDASDLAMVQKRVDAKDPEAIQFLAGQYYFGTLGLEKNVPRAIELWTEAAELGSIEALYELGLGFSKGERGVQDRAEAARYFKLAAMKGHVASRHNLGQFESSCERAVRHYMISAKMGNKASIDIVKVMFATGHATKEQYAEALKGYQAAVEETKSPERDVANALLEQKHKESVN